MKYLEAINIAENLEIGKLSNGITTVKKIVDNDSGKTLAKPNPTEKDIAIAIYNYLKANKKELLVKKWDLRTPDITFSADGTANINFDDGGGIKIPEIVYQKYM